MKARRHVSTTILMISCASLPAIVSTSALAQDRDTGTSEDAEPGKGNLHKFKPLALTANPLSMLISRYGANVEYLPVPHHGIMLNPYFSSMDVSAGNAKTSYRSYGAELGYHFYTGTNGANGFFVGPSLLFASSKSSFECAEPGCRPPVGMSFNSYGIALDAGGQYISKTGFTIGGGGGLMYLKASSKGTPTSSTVKFEGTVPRFLFTVGYST